MRPDLHPDHPVWRRIQISLLHDQSEEDWFPESSPRSGAEALPGYWGSAHPQILYSRCSPVEGWKVSEVLVLHEILLTIVINPDPHCKVFWSRTAHINGKKYLTGM